MEGQGLLWTSSESFLLPSVPLVGPMSLSVVASFYPAVREPQLVLRGMVDRGMDTATTAKS